MAVEISDEEWRRLERERDALIDKVCSPDLDLDQVERGVVGCYRSLGCGTPEIIWVDGPESIVPTAARRAAGISTTSKAYRSTASELLQGMIYGGWWLASIHYHLLVASIPGVEPLDPDLKQRAEQWRDALMCHAWLPLDDCAILSRPHHTLHRNERGSLHCLDGPAWAWADGTEISAIDGIRIPGWTLDPDVDVRRYLSDITNAEQRRVLFQRYGWAKAAEEMEWKVIHDSGDPYTGILYRLPDGVLEDDDGEDFNLLVGRNASPHPGGEFAYYGLPVSRAHKTAQEAQALSLWGVPVDEWMRVKART